MNHDIISLVVLLIVVGAGLYILQLLSIDNVSKAIIRVILIVALVIYIIKMFAPMIF